MALHYFLSFVARSKIYFRTIPRSLCSTIHLQISLRSFLAVSSDTLTCSMTCVCQFLQAFSSDDLSRKFSTVFFYYYYSPVLVWFTVINPLSVQGIFMCAIQIFMLVFGKYVLIYSVSHNKKNIHIIVIYTTQF